MIIETTHTNKANNKLIEDLIGKPYSFFKAIKLKGVGSKRLIINDVSPNMEKYITKVSSINYANIELRPKGIIIHINKGLQNFSWAIPFYQLVIYKTNGTSIHAQGKYIHFKNNRTFKENKNFFKKLLNAKVEYDLEFNALPY